MAAERTRWTDERLDDDADRLDRFERNVDRRFDKVDERFERVDERFDGFERDVNGRFDKADGQIEQMGTKEQLDKLDSEWKERFTALGEKFDRLQLTLVGGLITIFGAVVMQSFLG